MIIITEYKATIQEAIAQAKGSSILRHAAKTMHLEQGHVARWPMKGNKSFMPEEKPLCITVEDGMTIAEVATLINVTEANMVKAFGSGAIDMKKLYLTTRGPWEASRIDIAKDGTMRRGWSLNACFSLFVH